MSNVEPQREFNFNTLGFKLGGRSYECIGGPYREARYARLSITWGYIPLRILCLTESPNEEIPDYHFPIQDFSVPDPRRMRAALKWFLKEMIFYRRPVYVCCGWGQGRTGLFLACVAKVFGESDPVEYVRAHYNYRAVETRPQEEFVRGFRVGTLRLWAWYYRLFGRK